MGNKVFQSLRDELKFFYTFKDDKSDGKNYFMDIEIVPNDSDDFVGLV